MFVFLKIHGVEDVATSDGPWKWLAEALKVFHPRCCCWKDRHEDRHEDRLAWSSGHVQVDFLGSQLLAMAATLWFMERCNQDHDWPLFLQNAGRYVCSDGNLLRGWQISAWIEQGSILPWVRILPACFLRLLPYVLLRVLLCWAESFIQQDRIDCVRPEVLEALLAAHSQWMQTTELFVDSMTSGRQRVKDGDYPAGNLMDVATLARLNIRIKQLLSKCPPEALDSLRSSRTYRQMDAGLQAAISRGPHAARQLIGVPASEKDL